MDQESLLSRIAQGDQAAVQQCLTRYGGLIWSLAKRFLGNAAEAEDAVQEIFVEIWKNAGRFNAQLSSESTYITMIARRRLIDRKRKIGRRPEVVTLPEAVPARVPETGSTLVDTADEAAVVLDAMASLRSEQQMVLKMAVYHGLTHDEIAQSTGLPLGTVKTHARRGLIRMRELLSAETDQKQTAVSGGIVL